MATDSISKIRYDLLPNFSTYGTPVASTAGLVFQSERSRNWERPFKTRRLAMLQLLRDGYLPTTSYVDNLQELVNSRVVRLTGCMYSDPRSTFDWSFIPSTPRFPVELTDGKVAALAASVLEQLQSRISGHGTNLYVSAAEARSTVEMIGERVGRFAKAYRHVRHCNFKAAAKALLLKRTPARVGRYQSADSNWLEYRYGWRLVVMDINSLMKTLYDSLTLRPPNFRVTAKALGVWNYAWVSPGLGLTLPNVGLSCCTYTQRKQTRFTGRVDGGYIYQLESVPLATGQSFGMLNPASFAWEIIPFSFVADWVVNVGSVLEGLTAFQGKRWLDGWLCKSFESSTSYQWTDFKKTSVTRLDPVIRPVLLGPVIERRFARNRQGFTPASLRVDVDINQQRVADAVGLFKQAFSKSRRS